jgi:hypothetical protein
MSAAALVNNATASVPPTESQPTTTPSPMTSIQLSNALIDIYENHNHRLHIPPNPIIRKTAHLTLIGQKAILADTGANCGATNNLEILWNYKRFETPLRITAYDNNNTNKNGLSAVGTGIIKIVTKDNQVLPCTTLYAPGSTGTILSPDRVTRDMTHITNYAIHGGKRKPTGRISFADAKGQIVATVNTRSSRDGLWYVTNPVLVPPKKQTINHLRIPNTNLRCHPTKQHSSP